MIYRSELIAEPMRITLNGAQTVSVTSMMACGVPCSHGAFLLLDAGLCRVGLLRRACKTRWRLRRKRVQQRPLADAAG